MQMGRMCIHINCEERRGAMWNPLNLKHIYTHLICIILPLSRSFYHWWQPFAIPCYWYQFILMQTKWWYEKYEQSRFSEYWILPQWQIVRLCCYCCCCYYWIVRQSRFVYRFEKGNRCTNNINSSVYAILWYRKIFVCLFVYLRWVQNSIRFTIRLVLESLLLFFSLLSNNHIWEDSIANIYFLKNLTLWKWRKSLIDKYLNSTAFACIKICACVYRSSSTTIWLLIGNTLDAVATKYHVNINKLLTHGCPFSFPH